MTCIMKWVKRDPRQGILPCFDAACVYCSVANTGIIIQPDFKRREGCHVAAGLVYYSDARKFMYITKSMIL